MAVITTAAAGNSSSTATWTGGVIPSNGDTVLVNHALVIDQSIIVGTSLGENNAVQAILVTEAGASLTIATGATLTTRGDIVLNNNPFVMQAGSGLVFDSSQAVAPSTTSYFLKVGSANPSTSAAFSANGTVNSRVTITSDPAGANGYITKGSFYGGSVVATYTDFSRLGDSAHTTAIAFLPNTDGKTWIFNDNSFSELGGKIVVGRCSGATGLIEFSRNMFKNNKYYPILSLGAYAGNAGKRLLKNNWFDKRVEWDSSAGMSSWTIDGNTFLSAILAADPPSGSVESFRNNTFLDEDGKAFCFAFNNNLGTVVDSLVLWNNINGQHYDGTWYSYKMNYDGGVVENTYNIAEAPNIFSAPLALGSVAQTSFKNLLFAPSASGGSAGFFGHLKGNKNTRITYENNSALVTHTAPQSGFYAGSGALHHPGMLASLKNNLFWTTPVQRVPLNDYGLRTIRYINGSSSTANIWTGTGQAGGSTTVLVTILNYFSTTTGSLEGHKVKIGGEIRTVVSNTSSSVTVDTPFSVTTVGASFEMYGIDQVTAATNNGWVGFLADGTIYGPDNTVAISNKIGYDGFTLTDPSTLGTNDVVLSSLAFVDATRSIATFATTGLGNPVNSAWVDATVYAESGGVSKSVIGFYAGAVINYRARIAHTSNSRTSPGGFTSFSIVASTVANTVKALVTTATPHGFVVGDRVKINNSPVHLSWTILSVPTDTTFTIDNQILLGAGTNVTIYQDWRDYWEFEGLYEMRKAQLQETGYNPAATQPQALSWIKAGYAPTNMALATAGEGGTYIGAVMPYIAPSARMQSTFGFSSGFNKFNS